MTAHTITAECEAEIRAISDERAAWFERLKAANATGPTGAALDELMTWSDKIDARVDVARRRWFPRVHELLVTTTGACTASRTRRSQRTVWDR